MSDVADVRQETSDVTVIVTSFNHQAYIEQCLDSIAAQTQLPRQVIVIDDCSQDDSPDVIEHWLTTSGQPFTFIRHERNLGVCASLNEALAIADGRYLCHVSGDDWEESDRLERQVSAFDREDADTAILVGDIREVDAGGASIFDHDFGKRLGHMAGPQMQSTLLSHLLAENVIPAPGVMVRTGLIREIGGFDEALAFEDYDMWLRLSTRYSMAYERGIVANYRQTGSSMLRNPTRRVSILRSEADMLAKHLGDGAQNDATIAHRLVRIAGQLLEIGATAALRRVLATALSASSEPWIRRAMRTSYLPGGLARVRRRHAVNFSSQLNCTE